jgi:hypothetical protein
MNHYQSEFGGGLGDIILNAHIDRRYMTICNLPEGSSATVFIQSPNPFAHEIFSECPSALMGRLQVISTGWFWSDDAEELKDMRVLRGMPRETKRYEVPQWGPEVVWYPSLPDWQIINGRILETQGSSMILIEPSAGDSVRTMPDGYFEQIAATVIKAGLTPVLIGRAYDHAGRVVRSGAEITGLIDLTDRLTVPGVLRLVRFCKGVVCTHSAIHHAAAKDRIRNFCLYPKLMQTAPGYAYQKAMAATEEGDMMHFWGVRQPECTSSTFEDFNPDKLKTWLSTL